MATSRSLSGGGRKDEALPISKTTTITIGAAACVVGVMLALAGMVVKEASAATEALARFDATLQDVRDDVRDIKTKMDGNNGVLSRIARLEEKIRNIEKAIEKLKDPIP